MIHSESITKYIIVFAKNHSRFVKKRILLSMMRRETQSALREAARHGPVVGRSIPEHEHVVRLHSAVVNYDYLSGGRSRLPEIRFVSEMLECDLEVALVHGLPELHR